MGFGDELSVLLRCELRQSFDLLASSSHRIVGVTRNLPEPTSD
jgi:hypothetical protein